MIWVAGRSPTLVSQNLKATTLTYLAIGQATGLEAPFSRWQLSIMQVLFSIAMNLFT
jgi:hypothetical protein